jgi:SAM-dependent methyltransferase
MKFKLHQPTLNLLENLSGVELGAATHNPFGVQAINVAPELNFEMYRDSQVSMGENPLLIDLYGHAANIPVDDHSQDFVLSSHVIEHIPDPISAFFEWQRVIKPGGYVVAIIPQPYAMPEDKRPLSSHAQILQAYHQRWTPETAPQGSIFNDHHWKFSSTTFRGLMQKIISGWSDVPRLPWKLVGAEDPDSKVGNGFWVAYRVLG